MLATIHRCRKEIAKPRKCVEVRHIADRDTVWGISSVVLKAQATRRPRDQVVPGLLDGPVRIVVIV
jgi:hypothetical protein